MTRNELVKVLKVVSDKTRLDILSSIYLKPEISGKELLVSHHISQPTLSFHLARLQEAKIILTKKLVKHTTMK